MRSPFKTHKRTIITVVLRLVVVLAIAGGLFLYWKQTMEPGITPPGPRQGTGIKLPTQPGSGTIPPSQLSPTIKNTTPLANIPGMPHVRGNSILDGSSHPMVLRGAHVTSAFNYILAWNHGADPFIALNPNVFTAMREWGMNIVRIPITNWIYQLSPASYLAKLDTVVREANAARLYVVIDDHDDDQAGSPYGSGADVPKPETITFWKAIASHYRTNPMIMFDIINEPKQTDWSTWLHGGGTITGSTGKAAPIVGMQDVVNAIRSVGAPQIIIAEASTEMDGFAGIGNDLIQDPNIVYSIHEYFDYRPNNDLDRSPAGWDVMFGNLSATHPVFIGEWAFLPNANHPVFCENITTFQAVQLVQSFLLYMQQHQVSWTAWNFDPYHLIQDYTSFTPTTLNVPWHCGDMSSHAGMGTIIKQYLLTNAGVA
jgi:aryl-phospho-beta-D-glucosidase BglC (GH1 family)